MKNFLLILTIVFVSLILGYTVIGTPSRVTEIKKRVPQEITERNWKLLRYEGYQWGSWNNHGGKYWYHVCNIDNPNIQYRVYVTLWNNELQWYYGAPENLSRFEVNLSK